MKPESNSHLTGMETKKGFVMVILRISRTAGSLQGFRKGWMQTDKKSTLRGRQQGF